MHRLSFYLFRQLLIAFLFATIAVSFVVLFTQSFRLLSLVIENASTATIFLQLMILSVPTFLPLVLPLGLGVATIFIYNKLAIDNELVVMRAAGVSPLRQSKPALILSALILVTCYTFTLWLTPAANRGLVALQYQVRDGYAIFLSKPGNFNDITDGLTFYARKRSPEGALEGILIHDVRVPQSPVTIMADTGQVVESKGQPQIVVFNGHRQEMDVNTGKLTELSFEQYVLDLNALRSAARKRLPDPREQTVWDLISPSTEMLRNRASREHLLAELHQRLASPLLALAYTLIGLAAILSGEFNRRGMGKRIIVASVTIIAIQAEFMSMSGIITKHLWLAFVLYLLAIVPIILSFGFFNMDRLRPRPQFLPAGAKK